MPRRKKENMFAEDQAAREKEQAAITAAVTGQAQGRKEQKNLRKDENGQQIKITLSVTQEDKEKVKMFAIKNRKSVSDLFHEWVAANC